MLVMDSKKGAGVPIDRVQAVAAAQFSCDLDDWRHAARRQLLEAREAKQVAEKRLLERKLAECRPLPLLPWCECDELCITPCPVFVGCCEEKWCYEVPLVICRPRRRPGIERILMERAYLGLLTRMRTFDWQVTHGHIVGVKNGIHFDIFV